MNTQLTILNENSIVEDLANLLSSLPDEMLFYREHGYRHPLATYNVSIQRVYDAVSKFLSETRTINEKIDCLKAKAMPYTKEVYVLKKGIEQTKNRDESQKRIDELKKLLASISKDEAEVKRGFLKDYKEILDSIMAFIDGTYIILKSLYPIDAVNRETKFAYDWVRCADRNISYNYYDKIKDYRSNVAVKVNKIKHNTQRLNFVRFTTNLGRICGYFVEGVDPKDGSIISDIEIHKMYDGQYTAISFNYDLKYNLIGIFHTIKSLTNAINSIIYKKYKKSIKLNEDLLGNERWFSIVNEIECIPNLFFIDEYNKEIPIITTNLKSGHINLKCGKTNNVLKYSGQYIVESSVTSDGVTKAIGVVYYKGK